MKHEILGEIVQSEDDIFDCIAMITWHSNEIEIGIIRDGEPIESALELAVQVVKGLGDIDATAKNAAASRLLKVYNDGWNEYDEVQEDGSLKSVENPWLSASEFTSKLTLDSIHVYGSGMFTFYYDDGGMFWGHTVTVTSMSGTTSPKRTPTYLGDGLRA